MNAAKITVAIFFLTLWGIHARSYLPFESVEERSLRTWLYFSQKSLQPNELVFRIELEPSNETLTVTFREEHELRRAFRLSSLLITSRFFSQPKSGAESETVSVSISEGTRKFSRKVALSRLRETMAFKNFLRLAAEYQHIAANERGNAELSDQSESLETS